jgi:ABC-type transport system involved in Fe-S cluster assembly fused permease/ATPase subunit
VNYNFVNSCIFDVNVVIAHRLATIVDADEIIVLGHGGMVEERGTHEQLLQRNGTYPVSKIRCQTIVN